MRILLLVVALCAPLTLLGAAPAHRVETLPNGLTVVAVHDATSAVAGLHLGVRYDPAAIPPERNGLAALSQQILQDKLRHVSEQEQWKELGEQLRATRASLVLNTESDYCEIRGQMSYEALPQALRLAGHLLFTEQPVTSEELQLAREVLAAANKSSGTTVVEQTYFCFLRALLGPKAPLARPVQGTPETLKAVTLGDIAEFRKTEMAPNHAFLTVIAPQSLEDILALARQALGTLPKSERPNPPSRAKLLGRDRVYVAAMPGWRAVSLMVGVAAPPYGTRDYLLAQLLFSLLEGEHGRLERDESLRSGLGLNRIVTRDEDGPAVSVLAPMATPQPFIALHMVLGPRQMEQARERLVGHLQSLRETPPAGPELELARQRLLNSYALLQLRRADLAKTINCVPIYGGDLALAFAPESVIAQATPEELTAVAKKWFGTHAVGVLMPGDE